ncbi:Thylakoid membrane protein slr0575 [Galdieria sulphuraria]|nr:Thylakoid membrane protein slr0575 [Galdieria sulphuraria]
MSQSQQSYMLPTKTPSWAKLTIALGSLITIYSFYEYFSSGGAVSGSALGFVYGLPILLLGLALQYAELAPTPLKTSDEAKEKREYLATDVQKKLIRDVTRYRYGNQVHLEQVWKALGLVSRGQSRPILKQVLERIDETSSRYELCLLLYAVGSQVSFWEQKLEKMNRFFGPNIVCRIEPVEEDQFCRY